MKCIKIFIVRIDSIARKTTAKTIGTIVHGFHALVYFLAGHFISVFRDNGRNSTTGRNSDFTFHSHNKNLPFIFVTKRKRRSFKHCVFKRTPLLICEYYTPSNIFLSRNFFKFFSQKSLRKTIELS